MTFKGLYRNEHERKALEAQGFYVHAIAAEDYKGDHANIHTHCVKENFKHMDLQITLDAPPLSCSSIIHAVVNRIKEGAIFSGGEEHFGVLTGGLPLGFKTYSEGGRDVLRILIPDNKGLLPNHPDCEPFFARQLVDYNFDNTQETKYNFKNKPNKK